MMAQEKLSKIEEDFASMLKKGTYEVTPGDINWMIERIKKLTLGLEFYAGLKGPFRSLDTTFDDLGSLARKTLQD